MISNKYILELVEEIKDKKLTKQEIGRLKTGLCKKYKLKKIPTDSDIIQYASVDDLPLIRKALLRKPTRTISGVAVIALMCKPYICPHGTCSYCPGGLDSEFGSVPKSYTGKEPSAMRSMRNHYDPYLITFNRLEQYYVSGHFAEKAEVIIQGGTFNFYPHNYQEYFVKYILKAMNDFSRLFFKDGEFDILKFKEFFELPSELTTQRTAKIHSKILSMKYDFLKNCNISHNCNEKISQQEYIYGEPSLEEVQLENETTKIRCVGLTIETRADYGKLRDGNRMLNFGCTRVEIGVQSVYDDVLKKVKRGHNVNDTIESFRILKDLGFKITAHYMPGLPLTTKEMDTNGLRQLFENPDFRPDMLKIYPCMVMRGTKLYTEWKQGKFKPITTKQAAELIAEFKSHVPKYCRIVRVQRDIPTYLTNAGVDKTNLRQYIAKIMREKGIKCSCIRCREAGIVLLNKNIRVERLLFHQSMTAGMTNLEKMRTEHFDKIEILVYEYSASNGKEFFISAEDIKNDILFGYCRLRFPSQFLRKEITKYSALIRELHVYSPAVPIGKLSEDSFQHRGIGKRLMQKAEEIARTYKKNKMVVIAGIGAREYFRKIGYEREGVYMIKRI